jgi:hypothetical protein
MKRKTLPKYSTKRGFFVISQVLNRHYRDLRRLSKHKIPPSKHQTKQNSKEKGVRDCLGKQCVYTQLAVRQHPCVCNCQAKMRVYALKQGQAREKRLKTQTQSEQELLSNDTTRTTIENRAI